MNELKLPLVLAGIKPVALRLGYAPQLPDPGSGLFEHMVDFFGRWRWCNDHVADAGPCLIMWNYSTKIGLEDVITSTTLDGILIHTVRDPTDFIRKMRRLGPNSLQIVEIDDKLRVICTNHRDQKAYDDGDAIFGTLPRPLQAVRDFHASVVQLQRNAEDESPTEVMATVHGREVREEMCKEAGCDLTQPDAVRSPASSNVLETDVFECPTCGLLYVDQPMVQIPEGAAAVDGGDSDV